MWKRRKWKLFGKLSNAHFQGRDFHCIVTFILNYCSRQHNHFSYVSVGIFRENKKSTLYLRFSVLESPDLRVLVDPLNLGPILENIGPQGPCGPFWLSLIDSFDFLLPPLSEINSRLRISHDTDALNFYLFPFSHIKLKNKLNTFSNIEVSNNYLDINDWIIVLL